MKRVLVVGDLHCGSVVGLTPKAYRFRNKGIGRTKRDKYHKIQDQTDEEYLRLLDSIGPVDVALYLGDGIDGTGFRSGGTELITSDREEQSDMCVMCLDEIRKRAKKNYKIVGVYGTGYHTGDSEDWENVIADRAGFEKIGSHEWAEVEGVVFDIKHHIGSSSIPHGRHTAISKDAYWNRLWAEQESQPKADVILRGHVHYFSYCGNSEFLAMTIPALQAMGTKYGSRRCSGLVDWGLITFDVEDGKILDWKAHISRLSSQKAKTIKL